MGFSSCSLKNMFLNEPIKKKHTHTCTLHILYVSPSAVLAPPAHPASRFCNYPPIFHLCHSIPTHLTSREGIHTCFPRSSFTSTCLCLFSVCFLSASTGGSGLKPFSSSAPLLHNSLYSSFTSPSLFLPISSPPSTSAPPFFVILLHICGETALLFFFTFIFSH